MFSYYVVLINCIENFKTQVLKQNYVRNALNFSNNLFVAMYDIYPRSLVTHFKMHLFELVLRDVA